MCRYVCESCEETWGRGCDCEDILWDLCPECEIDFEDFEEECSCVNDEKDLRCRSCFGGE